jgi:hypothetical protein
METEAGYDPENAALAKIQKLQQSPYIKHINNNSNGR